MATITVHPEHVDGLRYIVIGCEFERACEEQDVRALRTLLDLGDQLGWDGDERTEPFEITLSDAMLDKLSEEAWSHGNSLMGDFYSERVATSEHRLSPEQVERIGREARSMLAFHEHGQKVAS